MAAGVLVEYLNELVLEVLVPGCDKVCECTAVPGCDKVCECTAVPGWRAEKTVLQENAGVTTGGRAECFGTRLPVGLCDLVVLEEVVVTLKLCRGGCIVELDLGVASRCVNQTIPSMSF